MRQPRRSKEEKARAEAEEAAAVEARQVAAEEAPTVYVGTAFDAELGPCPLCMGSAMGVKFCFVPMGQVGKDRWKSLPPGEYHRARVPAGVVARAEAQFAADRERVSVYLAKQGRATG